MTTLQESFNTPWKAWNWLGSWMVYPGARLLFATNGIPWGQRWHLYGLPIIQKHRRSMMHFGSGLNLRSSVVSNPLGPNHPVILCTWGPGAVLEIGDDFAMTGGSICAAERITIGRNVTIGANSTIADTDFHPLNPEIRRQHPQESDTAPILIEDDVFIGMNCLIMKGVTIGQGSVIGAGSVVTRNVPPCVIAAGNPARVIREM
jgi:acetyltransferase-like isoleucine patch superfamily enzyme